MRPSKLNEIMSAGLDAIYDKLEEEGLEAPALFLAVHTNANKVPETATATNGSAKELAHMGVALAKVAGEQMEAEGHPLPEKTKEMFDKFELFKAPKREMH